MLEKGRGRDLSFTNLSLPLLMPKTRPLCTGAELNLGDRVVGEVLERIALLLCQAKGGIAGSCLKNCVSQPGGGFGEEFYSSGSRAGLLIMIRVCAGLARP